MIQEEEKPCKLTFNVISSPVIASFNFSRVFNFDFICKHEYSEYAQQNKSKALSTLPRRNLKTALYFSG